jgi:hypothetical protein
VRENRTKHFKPNTAYTVDQNDGFPTKKLYFFLDLVPLQSKIHSFAKLTFSRQNYLLYFGKGNFGGKKFNLQKSEFTL